MDILLKTVMLLVVAGAFLIALCVFLFVGFLIYEKVKNRSGNGPNGSLRERLY